MSPTRLSLPSARLAAIAFLLALVAVSPAASSAATYTPAPALAQPATAAHLVSSRVAFAWQAQADAAQYEIRLSRNARFHLVLDVRTQRPRASRILADGAWWWKVRSLSPHRSRWSDARRIAIKARKDIIAPTRPRAPHVTATTRAGITLAFGASRDAFGVARYDIFAAGRKKAVAHAKGSARSVTVPFACASHILVLTVQAVDRAGNRSQRSPVARGRTRGCGGALPAPPTELVVSARDMRSVTLGWKAPAGSARIQDYLVTRNGTSLGRPKGTAYTATGLAASTTYVFTVQARDAGGQLSLPATLTVDTSNPVQSTGKLHAHLLSSDGTASFADFQAHYTQIGWVYLTDYEVVVDGDGSAQVTGTYSAAIAHWAQARGIKVLPRFHSENTNVLHAVLANPDNRSLLIQEISQIVATDGADGANIDFEGGYCPAAATCDRGALTAFAAGLGAALHAQGHLLSMDVTAKTAETTSGRAAFYDYAALAASSDEILILAWNPHYSTSMPGPVANQLRTCAGQPCAWSQLVASYAAPLVPAAKLTLATSLYGFDWTYRRVVGPHPVTAVNMHNPAGTVIGQTTNIVPAGMTLTAVPGVWTGRDATAPTYTWLRCPSFKVDATCTTVGSGLAYTVHTADVQATTQPYLFVAELVHNATGTAAQVSGIRTQATDFRPSTAGEYCVASSAAGALQLTPARPVTDATGVIGTVVAPGNACLVAPGIAREYSNDLPEDNPDIFSPFHIGIAQVLARTAAAGIHVTEGVDPLSGEHVAVWIDAAGLEHQMWWADGASAGGALAAYAALGDGIGVWRLGREDPAFWQQPLLAGV
jgi:spore germination protein YaaH